MEECKDYIARKNMLIEQQGNRLMGIRGLFVKKLDEQAAIPTQSNRSDAGWDLYANHQDCIQPNSRALIKTGISLEIPDGFVGLIWPRSGLAVKNGLDVFAGVVDAGYRGEVGVCLFNSSETEVKIKQGDRIAQILFQPVPQFQIVEVEELGSTERGSGGFGSTGK